MKHFIKYIVPNTPCNSISKEIGQSLISAGGSVLSGILGAFGLNDQTKKAYKYNSKLMEQQQGYNVTNLNLQRDINKELARYGYDLENEYNSPTVQRQKMEAAGLNPYYNEQGAVSAASNPNMQSVSQPSVSIPNFEAQSPWSAFANLPADFAQIANATKAIAEAKKAGVETDQLSALFDTIVKSAGEDLIGKQLANKYQKVISDWWSEHGHQHLNNQDLKLLEEIGTLSTKMDLDKALKRLNDAKAQELENKNSIWSNIKDFVISSYDLSNKLTSAQITTEGTKQNLNNAQAQSAIMVGKAASLNASANLMLAKAQSMTENELRPLRKSLYNLDIDLKEYDKTFVDATLKNRIILVGKELERAGLMNNEIKESVSRAIYENDTRVIKDLFDGYIRLLSTLSQAAGNTATAVVGAKVVGAKNLQTSGIPLKNVDSSSKPNYYPQYW